MALPDKIKLLITYRGYADEPTKNAPTIDAVPAERYNDLREAFVDYVCTGVQNPAPYCTNRRPECVDGRGWCRTENCRGFNPDGETEADHATEENKPAP